MAAIEIHAKYITELFGAGKTHSEMSSTLKQHGVKMCSEMSIRRFCEKHNLRRKGLVTDTELERAVLGSIRETGPSYGRKFMTGYLASGGVRAAERRVGKNLNPIPYQGRYMGHKLHMDQNEKLVMFGVTHVLAMDGYSGNIVAHSSMPVKNNLVIYEEVYRSAVMRYGMWDQLRVDHGREFYLCLYMQEKLSGRRHNTSGPPYRQTASTMNHRVERIWSEVNQRVNYPLKEALIQLIQLQDHEQIDIEDALTKYCTSNLTRTLSEIGLCRMIQAWNAHRVPGRGIPNDLVAGGCPVKITEALLPSASIVANMYEAELGSSLTWASEFANDPFPSEEDKCHVEEMFAHQYPDVSVLFNDAVNANYIPLQNALCNLIVTRRQI
ncbi:uncharacterized protein LOC134092702 [Sardina pilchardus]|uniref:uncharacterized protein LOC134092702 n=1 Tax=Sardina pilchardus TaxID=27697 RepID=UPI002E13D02E